MDQERRETWKRRKSDRRQAGKVIPLDDTNFQTEIVDIPVFGLVQFGCKWSEHCKKQERILKQIAEDFKDTQRLRVGVFELCPENMKVPIQYGLISIPTLILFHRGQILYRMNTNESRSVLKKILDTVMAADTTVFVERRRGRERRSRDRRGADDIQSVQWHDLARFVATTPWSVLLSMNPETPEAGREFSTLVESAVRGLKREDLRTFHVVGEPPPPVQKYFGLTVAPPAVAIFNEGKLIGQFGDIRSKGDLQKKLREALP
jgi:thioredoxin 1